MGRKQFFRPALRDSTNAKERNPSAEALGYCQGKTDSRVDKIVGQPLRLPGRHGRRCACPTRKRATIVPALKRWAMIKGNQSSPIRSTRRREPGHISLAMNLKTLRKKIRKLETRLQEGPGKLARWKRKLEAMTKEKARKAQKKLAARAAAPRRTTQAPAPTKKKTSRPTAQPQTKAAVAKKPSPAKKPKRKRNVSPERRAQLSAAMKARWAAKRAAQTSPSEGEFAHEGNPQSP